MMSSIYGRVSEDARAVSAFCARLASLVIALALCVVFSLGGQAVAQEAESNLAERAYAGFSDVQPTDWYAESGVIDYVVDSGLMSGYGGTDRFAPNDIITRGQVAVVLWRMAGEPFAGAPAFNDVDYFQYYGQAILWATKVGIVGGYGDGRYGPDDPVTREQLCSMLANFTESNGHQSTYSNCRALDRIAGANQVSSWARGAMGWAVDKGIISGSIDSNGTTNVNPGGLSLRCEFAKMISVEHRDVLNLGIGGIAYDELPVTKTGDTVCLTGDLQQAWWQHPAQGWQEFYLFRPDDPVTVAVLDGGSYRTYFNQTEIQLYENSGSLSESVLNRRVTVVGEVFDAVNTWYQRRDVLLRGCVVAPA